MAWYGQLGCNVIQTFAVSCNGYAWYKDGVVPEFVAPASSSFVLEGANGPGAGKHIVVVSGDEEYRSEESLPMLARILAGRHGFKCTVLFAVNQQTGEIDPNTLDNIPGLEALAGADLMVVCTRLHLGFPPRCIRPGKYPGRSGRSYEVASDLARRGNPVGAHRRLHH